MITHAINPVLLKLGVVEIRWYGVMYALGILIAYFFMRHAVRKNEIKNLDENLFNDLFLYLVVGVVAGARLFFFVFYAPSIFITDPFELFRVWHGGMSFHGSLIGISVVLFWFCRKHKIPFYQLADVAAIPAALALFFGRIANFIGSELIGTRTNLPFCVQYENVDGCRHPSQLYESLKNLFIFFVLFSLKTKKRLKEGTLAWLFVLLYGSLRFLITFFREDPRWLGLSMGQYLSLAMVIVAGFVLLKRKGLLRK